MDTAKRDAKKQRTAERAGRREHRRLARERLVALRGKLKESLATRKVRMKELAGTCRAQRLAVRDQIRAMWTDGRRAIGERAAAERLVVKQACIAGKTRAKETCDSAIAYARAALAAERRRAVEERRINQEERDRHAALQRAHESGAAHALVRAAMLGQLGPLYERVRPAGTLAGQSRVEAILHYAETHPEEVHAIVQPAAERAIEQTKAEIAAVERSMDASTTGELQRAHRARKKRPSGDGRPPRKKGELRSGDPGMLIADLLRERDEVAAKKAARKAAESAKTTAGRGRLTMVPKAAPTNEAVPDARGRYGVHWTDANGRTGWALRSGDGSPAWTGSYDEAYGRARKLTATSSTKTDYDARLYSGTLERERLLKLAQRPEAQVKAPELRDTADIAKRIREDIKAAAKSGKLPSATYSVRTEKYSMGSSIHVEASKLPFPVINPDAFIVHRGESHVSYDSSRFRSRFTPKAQEVEVKLNAIVDAYHWDRSDHMTDYYNERFHKDVRLTEDKGEWQRMEAAKVAAAKATG
jgi:hypothetical protein